MSGSEASRGNPFGHIDLRVPSAAAALPFYEELLSPLGFTARYEGGVWHVCSRRPTRCRRRRTSGSPRAPTSCRTRTGIASWAVDRAEVERTTR